MLERTPPAATGRTRFHTPEVYLGGGRADAPSTGQGPDDLQRGAHLPCRSPTTNPAAFCRGVVVAAAAADAHAAVREPAETFCWTAPDLAEARDSRTAGPAVPSGGRHYVPPAAGTRLSGTAAQAERLMHRHSEKQLKGTQRPFAIAGPQRVPRPPGLRGIRGTKVFLATLGCCTRYTCPGQGTRCQRGLLLALVVDEEMWQAFAEFQTANAALPGYLKEMPSTFRIAQSNSCCSPVQPRISLDAPTPGDHLRGQKQMTD